MSRREIAKRLAVIGEDVNALDAVLITHEHCDHTSGLTALIRRAARPLPVYLTERTAHCIDWGEKTPGENTAALEYFGAGLSFSVGDFEISSFTIPHDADDPVGFTVKAHGVKIAIVTDLGYITPNIPHHLRLSDLVLLEANHDIEILRTGPYPWSVKQRVMSRRGHLSNDVAADFIRNHLDSRLSTLVLGHISQHNNYVPIVRQMGLKALDGRSLFTTLHVAEPGIQSEVFCY